MVFLIVANSSQLEELCSAIAIARSWVEAAFKSSLDFFPHVSAFLRYCLTVMTFNFHVFQFAQFKYTGVSYILYNSKTCCVTHVIAIYTMDDAIDQLCRNDPTIYSCPLTSTERLLSQLNASCADSFITSPKTKEYRIK